MARTEGGRDRASKMGDDDDDSNGDDGHLRADDGDDDDNDDDSEGGGGLRDNDDEEGKRAGTGWIADRRRRVHAHHISHCLRKSSLFEESTIYFFLLCLFIVKQVSA
jgi:hypothetical protein